MSLVDYQIVPVHRLEQAFLYHTHFVRSDQHVPASVFLANHRLQVDSLFFCAMKTQDAERRTELLDLIHPVAKRRFRNQNQVRTAIIDSLYPTDNLIDRYCFKKPKREIVSNVFPKPSNQSESSCWIPISSANILFNPSWCWCSSQFKASIW